MITVDILKQWGFIQVGQTVIEDVFSYDHYRILIKENEIDCFIDYNQDGTYAGHSFGFNGELITKQDLTIEDINLLKSIL